MWIRDSLFGLRRDYFFRAFQLLWRWGRELLVSYDGLDRPHSVLKEDSLFHNEAFKLSSLFWMDLARSCGRINGHFDAIGDWAKHILQCGTLSRLSSDFILTSFVMEWIVYATRASFTDATFITSPFYNHQDDVLLEDLILLIIPWRRFDWRLFSLCLLFLYMWGCLLGRAAACCFVSDLACTPASAPWPFCQ